MRKILALLPLVLPACDVLEAGDDRYSNPDAVCQSDPQSIFDDLLAEADEMGVKIVYVFDPQSGHGENDFRSDTISLPRGASGWSPMTAALIAHEMVHARQRHDLGLAVRGDVDEVLELQAYRETVRVLTMTMGEEAAHDWLLTTWVPNFSEEHGVDPFSALEAVTDGVMEPCR